jgi:hypothetical protein
MASCRSSLVAGVNTWLCTLVKVSDVSAVVVAILLSKLLVMLVLLLVDLKTLLFQLKLLRVVLIRVVVSFDLLPLAASKRLCTLVLDGLAMVCADVML